MTTKPKPGNQPDPDDMSGMFEQGGDPHDAPTAHPSPEEGEDPALKLGDFA